jgi:hypothetical protein
MFLLGLTIWFVAYFDHSERGSVRRVRKIIYLFILRYYKIVLHIFTYYNLLWKTS